MTHMTPCDLPYDTPCDNPQASPSSAAAPHWWMGRHQSAPSTACPRCGSWCGSWCCRVGNTRVTLHTLRCLSRINFKLRVFATSRPLPPPVSPRPQLRPAPLRSLSPPASHPMTLWSVDQVSLQGSSKWKFKKPLLANFWTRANEVPACTPLVYLSLCSAVVTKPPSYSSPLSCP